MDPTKLERARHILGASSDTETVDRALDLVIFQGDVSAAIDRLAAAGALRDVFGRRRRR